MNECKAEQDEFLTAQQKIVVSVIHDPGKRALSAHIGKAIVWVGPAIICIALGLHTMRSAYFIGAVLIMAVFIAIHVAVHWDFMNKVEAILNAYENRMRR